MERYFTCHTCNDMSQLLLKEFTNLPCCKSKNDIPSCKSALSDMPCQRSPSHLLTPPLSPEQSGTTIKELPAIDTFTSAFLSNPSTSSVDEILSNNFAHDFPSVLPDLKDTCTEVFDLEPQQYNRNLRNIFSLPSSKDCMWNGRGFRPKFRESQDSGYTSPLSPICSPDNGCVDPRFVFSHLGNSPSPSRLKPLNGTDSPNESDEEVDVVTVDKKSSLSKQQATVGVLSDGGKLVGTLVQKNDGSHPQLTLVTTGRNMLHGSNSARKSRPTSRAKNQSGVSMVINNGNGGTKTVNVQLKCVPITNSSGEFAKRRKPGVVGEQKSRTIVQLMRLTPTTQNIKNEGSTDTFPSRKKRFVSLDGISMVSNTGINRISTNQRNDVIKSEQTHSTKVEASNISSKDLKFVNVENKISKTKKATTNPYDSPTSSPGSVSIETTTYLKRKLPGGRSGLPETELRNYHNVLERQRRQSLRSLYYDLRCVVPDVRKLEKAPKVAILTKAKEYVLTLQKQASELELQKKILQTRQNQLQQKLSKLVLELAKVGTTEQLSYTSCPIKLEIPERNGHAVYVN